LLRAHTRRPRLFADDDQAAGQRIFAVRCASCHSVNAGDKKIGPTLAAVFGRSSGSVADFEYSPALKGAHLTWDGATLDKWLKNPPGLVRGTTMFVSVPSAADRGKLIAYLKSFRCHRTRRHRPFCRDVVDAAGACSSATLSRATS
jgi:cytochrome c